MITTLLLTLPAELINMLQSCCSYTYCIRQQSLDSNLQWTLHIGLLIVSRKLIGVYNIMPINLHLLIVAFWFASVYKVRLQFRSVYTLSKKAKKLIFRYIQKIFLCFCWNFEICTTERVLAMCNLLVNDLMCGVAHKSCLIILPCLLI